MGQRAFLIKLVVLVAVVVLESMFCAEFVGLIFLSVAFGLIWLWNTIYCIRYVLFLLISALLLIPAGWVLHDHFYNWQNQARQPLLAQLANTVESLYLTTGNSDLVKGMAVFTQQDDRKYDQFQVEIKDQNGVVQYHNNKHLDNLELNILSAKSKQGHVTVTYARMIRRYWEWDGTYFRYWRALLKGEMIFHNPPKYLDIFMLHMVLLLLVVIAYLQINFRRNYQQSKYLLGQLNAILEEKR